ncbi:hypothetical protein L2U69_14420 [Zavarzinia compransoris]|uniref:hypothetical protein n=1 Tax=Zavarzinia marina TaxID=2911065 RepID=UPI001F1C38E9|nr:hypothetical protein [Zavarzinia marina]MCF4166844.1 hypothetical protein [Zavarzinia marina]
MQIFNLARRGAFRVFALAGVVTVGGCVSILEGTSQDIAVNTTPPGAQCDFYREDKPIGSLSSTPGTLTVRKSKHDILIRCRKDGYQEATYNNHSGVSSTIAANVAMDVVLTLGVSSIIDSANGADNEYDGVVDIRLVPENPASKPGSFAGAMIGDRTGYFEMADGTTAVAYFAADGTLRRRHENCVDEGRWNADGVTLCSRAGKETLDSCVNVSGSPIQPEFYDTANPDTMKFRATHLAVGDAEKLMAAPICGEKDKDKMAHE